MKSVNEFIKTMVKIEFIENSDCFGHYPFQLFCEKENGELEFSALALGGDVRACFMQFIKHSNNKAERIYMSLDFPKGGDIENDFVAVFALENNNINVLAIPYSLKDGQVFKSIKDSVQLNRIKAQMISFF